MSYLEYLEKGIKKQCTKCKEEKLLTEFYKTFDRKKDQWRYRSHCKQCRITGARDYVKKKRS